ncbi:MAG: M23 family metallopeptidase [Propionicimonas sp.]|nr:M23 family metallopeptidase [Propionicimonas sp.]
MVNLLLVGLAIAFWVFAVIGLRGSWPMQLASFAVLTGWTIVLVWALLNVGRLAADDPAAGSSDDLAAYALVLAPVTGLGLAFLALVKCGPPVVPRLFHALGLVGLVLAIALVLVPNDEDSPVWVLVLAGAIPLVWGLAWLIPYLLLRGSVDPARYATAPVLLLPFPGGERTWVIQGNNSSFNHTHGNLTQDFAYDFRRGCGTPVLAAAGGQVTSVIDSNDGIGGPNNEVEVTHPDGSVASYLHVQKGSAAVAVGAYVNQGDQLAKAGSVGNSLTGHIHFHVRQGADTVPVKFSDVTRHAGVPRGFRFYTSGNAAPGP